MKKIVLDTKGAIERSSKPHAQHPGCRSHMVVLPGYGDRNFRFPDTQTLVNNALARLETRYGTDLAEEPEGEEHDTDAEDGAGGAGQTSLLHQPGKKGATPSFRIRFNHTFLPGLPTLGTVPQPLINKLPDAERLNMDGTLYLAAEAIHMVLEEGKYDALLAERFDGLAGAANWAAEHMDARYQPAIKSLGGQLWQLRSLYKEALPRVLSVLAAQNPDVPQQRLLGAALEVLDEELVQILTVLRIWTDAFAQLRDGMYKQLEAVTFVVEQAFNLFETGDFRGNCEGKDCTPQINSAVFKVGNVFLARFSNQGPATLPGTRGPIGAHAIEVPHDERHIIMLMLVLYAHEFRHDIFADVKGLAPELTHAVVSAVQKAFEEGQFTFAQDKVAFGRNRFSTIDIISKLFADTIGEVDADISGGVLLTGPAFLYNMVSTFSAFNAPEGVLKTQSLLRSSSYYELDEDNGQLSLYFLPHPPDYIRAYIVAAALEEIGFKAEADECRRLADQAVGEPLPEFITWEDVDGKSKSVIKIAVADLKQVAPVVAKALIRTPLKALGGLTTLDVVSWNPHRQEKVDVLAKLLMAGKSELPQGIGDIYATYVAAAATLAFWGLVKSGVRPLVAVRTVEENALKMLDEVRKHHNDTVTTRDDSECGCATAAPAADEPAKPKTAKSGRRKKVAEATTPGAAYMDEHWDVLPQNKWLACDNDGVVAQADTEGALVEAVAEAGLDTDEVTMAFISDEAAAE